MKQITRHTVYFILFSIIIISVSCKKQGNEDWGITNVYMPQAAMSDGGRTNNYPVPWSTANGTKNYVIDSVNNMVNIVLGVYRSGLQDKKSFSVEVAAKIDTTNKLITNGTVANAVILPSDVYTLPSTVTISKEQSEAIFYLKIDRKKLIDKYPAYSGKKLILAVGIVNPSNFLVNTSLSTTIIIIDSKLIIY